jgi:hypothetical protein
MLIINKVSNRVQQKRALNEMTTFDLESNLKRMRDEMARIFKFEFSADFAFDSGKLNEEIEKFRNEILRLHRLLRES